METRSVQTFQLGELGGTGLSDATQAACGAAVEAVAGLLDRALTQAEVDAGPYTDLVSPQLLSWTIRKMLHSGQAGIFFGTGPGGMTLRPVNHDWHPGTLGEWPPRVLWVEFLSPGGSTQQVVSYDEVALPAWSAPPERPWAGASPVSSGLQSRLLAEVVGVFRRETKAAHGYAIHLQGDEYTDQSNLRDAKKDVLTSLSPTMSLGNDQPSVNPYDYGKLFVTSTAGGAFLGGEGGAGAGNGVNPQRFGFAPPPELLAVAEWASNETLRALGCPPALLAENFSSGQQEWRRFLTATAGPLARRIALEIGRVVEYPVRIELDASRTGDDLAGRSRSVNSLRQAGVPLKVAMEISGLPVPDGMVEEPVAGQQPLRPANALDGVRDDNKDLERVPK